MNDRDNVCKNTDREIWRDWPGGFYADSIHVTGRGGIGINCGGHVIVAPVRKWHDCGERLLCVDPLLPRWRWKLAMWLLRWDRPPNPRRFIKGDSP